MKKVFFFVCIVLIFNQANAQITFDQNDVIISGSTAIQSHDDAPSVAPGSAGTNQIWDFSFLATSSADTITAMDPANSPYASDYPYSDLALHSGNGGNELYFFLTNNGTGLFIDGVAGDVSGMGLPLTVNFSPSNQLMEFPATYNTAFNGVYVFDETVASSAFPGADSVRIKSTTTKDAVIDAWGSLTIPTGTYDALRQNVNTSTVDSAWAHVAFLGWIPVFDTATVTHTYQWIAEEFGYVLVEMNVDPFDYPTNVDWISEYNLYTGISESQYNFVQLLYPNPSENEIRISFGNEATGFLEIYNIAGSLIRRESITGSDYLLDVSQLANGNYFIRFMDDKSAIIAQREFIIQR